MQTVGAKSSKWKPDGKTLCSKPTSKLTIQMHRWVSTWKFDMSRAINQRSVNAVNARNIPTRSNRLETMYNAFWKSKKHISRRQTVATRLWNQSRFTEWPLRLALPYGNADSRHFQKDFFRNWKCILPTAHKRLLPMVIVLLKEASRLKRAQEQRAAALER